MSWPAPLIIFEAEAMSQISLKYANLVFEHRDLGIDVVDPADHVILKAVKFRDKFAHCQT